jgi:hypothetical protein
VAAAVLLVAACASPDPFRDAQNAYARGDLNAANESLRVAADAGDAKAARALASMYETGMEVTGGQKIAKRPEEAARWYRRAAELGDQDAARRLGFMYAYGRGVPVDYAEAVRLLGPPTAEMAHGVRKYAAADQAEIEAWMLSLSLQMGQHSAALKRDFSEGAHVAIVLHAEDATVSFEPTTEAPERVRLAVVDAAKAALRDAPPTPAAERTRATAHFSFDFRYKD